jgi:hypothetical protein
MSYYIYSIAYRISDEIKAKKEAEKPYWWEHLHPEIKEKPIEEIDKMITDAGISPEKLAEMTKHEKYMAVSEGCYVVDSREAEKELSQMEALKKELERSKTSFIPQNTGSFGIPQQQQEFKAIEFGKTGEVPITPIATTPAFNPMDSHIEESSFTSPMKSPNMDIDDEHLNIMSSNINDDDLNGSNDSFGQSNNGGNDMGISMGSMGGGMGAASSPEVRKYAQSIVRQTVQQINHKADEIPDDVALMKEQELLQAVINELQTLK